MTTTYGTFRENAERRPTTPCFLAPPLRYVFRQQRGFGAEHPLVGGGRVYLLGKDGRALTLDEQTRRVLWSSKNQGTPRVLADGLLFASGKALYALAVESGQEVGRIEHYGALWAAERCGTLVAQTFRGSGVLYCVSLQSRQLLWDRRDAKDANQAVRFGGGFGIAPDRVVVGRSDGSAQALRLTDGKELWRTDVTLPDCRTGERVGAVNDDAAIVIDGDRVLLEVWPWGACALALESGEVLWQWQGYIPVQGYLYRDRYYVLGQVGQLTVLDPKSGRVLREGSLPRTYTPKAAREIERLCDPMLVSETHIWVGSEGGHVVAFDRETLEYAWHGQAKRASTHFFGSAFVSVNGRLYYGDQAFGVNCMEEVNATDPVLAASRAKANPAPKRKTRETATTPRRKGVSKPG